MGIIKGIDGEIDREAGCYTRERTAPFLPLCCSDPVAHVSSAVDAVPSEDSADKVVRAGRKADGTRRAGTGKEKTQKGLPSS